MKTYEEGRLSAFKEMRDWTKKEREGFERILPPHEIISEHTELRIRAKIILLKEFIEFAEAKMKVEK